MRCNAHKATSVIECNKCQLDRRRLQRHGLLELKGNNSLRPPAARVNATMSYKRENIIGQMERNVIRLACNVVMLWQKTCKE